MFVPGQEFTVSAKPGDRLSFATMFVQSNDKFYAPEKGGISLFDEGGAAVSGDFTASVRLFDAGTELDEQPGSGAHQAPRQNGPNNGPTETSVVRNADDGFVYPLVGDVLRITVKPAPQAQAS
jgi:hypothetical protein